MGQGEQRVVLDGGRVEIGNVFTIKEMETAIDVLRKANVETEFYTVRVHPQVRLVQLRVLGEHALARLWKRPARVRERAPGNLGSRRAFES